MIILQTIFWICCFAVAFTYVIYPLLLKVLASGAKTDYELYKQSDELPDITVVISVYNEEQVIEEKLRSVFNTSYPKEKLKVIIGSDNSTDKTLSIIHELKKEFPSIYLFEFDNRRGKPAVLNDLMKEVRSPIAVLTDANVMFIPATFYELVKHFRNTKIGLVGGNILNKGMRHDGISMVEETYIRNENVSKYQEGVVFGTMMGPFGGCYAIRPELYTTVPDNFLVDDFYICLKILGKKYKAILEPDAVCFEDVPNEVGVEFRRKERISAGNFQNLSVFFTFLLNPFSAKGFCFWSHKVLRWFTPFLAIIAYLCSLALACKGNIFFRYLFVLETLLLLSPLWDEIMKRMGTHVKSIRFMSYFCWMNLALIVGFFNYLKGIKTNVWEPTKRNK